MSAVLSLPLEARVVAFEVLGTPAPKGSGRAILVNGQARHVPSGSSQNAKAMKSWDSAVRAAAVEYLGAIAAPVFVGVPVVLTIVFHLRRPGSHYGAKGLKRNYENLWPCYKPDLSKLVRQTEDSLTGLVYDDDSRICRHVIEKVFAAPGREGAHIEVRQLI